MRAAVLFLFCCHLLALAQGGLISPSYNSLKVVSNSNPPHNESSKYPVLFGSHNSNFTHELYASYPLTNYKNHTTKLEKRRHFPKKPDWITQDVWDVLDSMAIKSVLPLPDAIPASNKPGSEDLPASLPQSNTGSIFNAPPTEALPLIVDELDTSSSADSSPNDELTIPPTAETTFGPNSTSPIGIEARGIPHRREVAAATSNSPFEDMPLPDFDPFGDLDEGNSTLHSDARNTRKFYEFTEANIIASRAAEWYGEWSRVRSSSSDWGPKAKGEWKLFIDEFTGNPNLQCNLGVACQNMMDLAHLVKVYPRNPQLVRRIYFIENLMSDWHDFNSLTDQGYERVTLLVTNNLQSLIGRVITKADPTKAAFCRLAHSLINLGVQVAATATGGMVGGVVQPYMQEGQTLAKLMQTFGKEILPKTADAVAGAGQRMSFNFNNLWQGIVNGQMYSVEGYINTAWALSPNWGGGLEGGKGNDPMCSAFEGDMQVSVDYNVKKLQGVLGDEFRTLHKQLGKVYRDLFYGTYAKAGQLSPTARMFINQKWTGSKSIASKIDNTDDFEAYFEMMMSMRLMSQMASSSHQYQKCNLDPAAAEKCAAAAQQTQPCKNPTSSRTKNCKRAVFCPRPDTEPNLICKAGAWYYAVTNGHETELPHLESWETMFKNRPGDEEVFNWNRTKMLQTTYDFYDLYHNNFDSYYASFGINAEDSTKGMIGLQIPVCNTMKGNVEDGRFPVGCGSDWRASETRQFMNSVGMGNTSQVYNDRDSGYPNELFVSIIPDALDNHYPQSISPVSHYATMCQLGIRHPDKTLDKIFAHKGRKGEDLPHMHVTHMEADQSCELVLTKTEGWTMDQADQWFCRDGAKEHTVFDREMYMTVTKPLLRTYDSYWDRCKKWKKRHTS